MPVRRRGITSDVRLVAGDDGEADPNHLDAVPAQLAVSSQHGAQLGVCRGWQFVSPPATWADWGSQAVAGGVEREGPCDLCHYVRFGSRIPETVMIVTVLVVGSVHPV